MTEQTQFAPGEAQQDLRGRVSASQARNRERADAAGRGTIDKAIDEHPLALLAGSLVLGVVAANLLQASWGRKLASRILGMAAVAGEVGAAYGSKTLEAAAEAGRTGQERLSRIGDAVAEESADVRRRAGEMSAEARRRALRLAAEAADEAREARATAVKKLGKLTKR